MKNKVTYYSLISAFSFFALIILMTYFNCFSYINNVAIFTSAIIVEVSIITPMFTAKINKLKAVRILTILGISLSIIFLVIFAITKSKIGLSIGIIYSILILFDSFIIGFFKK